MIKYLKLDVVVTFSIIDGQHSLKVSVPPGSVRDWLLCLYLLNDNTIESFIFTDNSGKSKIEIRLGELTEWNEASQRCHFKTSLSASALNYLRGFLARYYRDGAAEVDHIDIEADEPKFGYITVSVDEHRPPISSDELRRRLGIG